MNLKFKKIRLYGESRQADNRLLLIDGLPSSVWSHRHDGSWWLRASLCGVTEAGRGPDNLRTFQSLGDVEAWVVGAIDRERQFYKELNESYKAAPENFWETLINTTET